MSFLDDNNLWINQLLLGERVLDYLLFAAIVLATFLLKKPLAMLFSRLGSRVGTRHSFDSYKLIIIDTVLPPMERLMQVVLYYIAVNRLSHLLERVQIGAYLFGSRKGKTFTLQDVADHVFLFIFILFLGQVLLRFIDLFFGLSMKKAEDERNKSQQQLLPLISEIARLCIWAILSFWALGAVFHVNVPALITGLGIGGIAIALAGKETVENFFAAFTLLSDKPFTTGEIIRVDQYEGIVEQIGFRSTRLRTTDGAAVIIQNKTLVSQNLVNMTTGSTRAMKVTASIKYGIPYDALLRMVPHLEQRVAAIAPVQQPVTVVLEALEKDCYILTITYRLPHPIAEQYQLPAIKNNINLQLFAALEQYTPTGATPQVTTDHGE
ncbi:MAG: hypothetical protein EBZ77_11920 [Chitinophagia bacterium]|nr:hypothetical protein [Chitinophagia bacterium]